MRIAGWVAIAIAASLLYMLGFVNGASGEQAKASQLEQAQLRQAFEQGQALGVIRDRVVTQYVDRIVTVYKRGATITKEIPVYVSKAADAACVVPVGFVRVHDAGAANLPIAGGAGSANDAPSGVALSAVVDTVVDNYTDCHANAEQLKALQKWARDSHAIKNGSSAGE